MKIKKVVLSISIIGIVVLGAAALFTDLLREAHAADHAEAPAVAHDAGADIADVYTFLDPNDANNVVLIMTFHGFVAPQENVNLGFFPPEVLYRFELETSGDAKPDEFIDVQFAPRTSTATGQLATIKFPAKQTFTAFSTRASLADSAPAPVLTTNGNGIVFFAGLTDDPFFFDIPAFNRFVASVLGGAPDASIFLRGRDSFAGYNIPSIALSVPKSLIALQSTNNTLGVSGRTLRRVQKLEADGDIKATGAFRTADRMGLPAVATALIPFAKKNRYNAAKTTDDASGEFAADIVGTLTALGTTTPYINILASLAVAKGDILRLNLTIPNTGIGRGLPPTAAPDAFPNGRRLHDDVIDIILTLVANGNALGDNVDANDVSFRSEFPFLAPSQQPRANGVDDNTRN